VSVVPHPLCGSVGARSISATDVGVREGNDVHHTHDPVRQSMFAWVKRSSPKGIDPYLTPEKCSSPCRNPHITERNRLREQLQRHLHVPLGERPYPPSPSVRVCLQVVSLVPQGKKCPRCLESKAITACGRELYNATMSPRDENEKRIEKHRTDTLLSAEHLDFGAEVMDGVVARLSTQKR